MAVGDGVRDVDADGELDGEEEHVGCARRVMSTAEITEPECPDTAKVSC